MKTATNSKIERDVARKIAENSTKEKWSTWSLTPHTEEEIRHECLTNFDHVCFTYVCGTSKLSPEFIEEFMVLSSGVMCNAYREIERARTKEEELLAKERYDALFKKAQGAILFNLGVFGKEPEKNRFTAVHTSEVENLAGERRETDRIITDSTIIDRLDWYAISKFQKLPEWFMEKYSCMLNWKELKINQKMSDTLLKRHAAEIAK